MSMGDSCFSGITFSFPLHHINISTSTIEDLDFPEYYHFLFDPEELRFAMEGCGIDDEGAKRLPDFTMKRYCRIYSLNLLRLIYEVCGWDKRYPYRAPAYYIPEHNIVVFDIVSAIRIVDGRLENDKGKGRYRLA